MNYHKKIVVKSLADYLEVMSQSVFQTGISWRVVDAKWTGTKEAFRSFDPTVVSRFTMSDMAALAEDPRIIRNHRKIEAIVYNAKRLLELDKEFGGFRNYLRSFKSYDALAADIRKQFKFMGDVGIFRFLHIVGEKVPTWEEWMATHTTKRPVPMH